MVPSKTWAWLLSFLHSEKRNIYSSRAVTTHKSLSLSLSLSSDDFVSFLDNFELTLDTLAQKNPFLMVALGDFNAKSSNWYNKDITSDEGRKIEAVTSQNGLHQEINEPTHILKIALRVLI